MTRHKWSRNAAAAAMALGMGIGQARAVDYANIDVVDGAVAHVDAPTVSIPAGQGTVAGTGTEGFFIDPGTVIGEIPIRIGASAANDADQGILIVSAREILRTLGGATQSISGTTSTVRDGEVTSLNTRNQAGGLAIVTDRAGNDALGTSWPTIGGPMNLNVGATYFPFSQGWKGGTVYASANNGPLDTFIGSPGFTFDPTVGSANTAHVRPNHLFVEPYDVGDPTKNGNHVVSIPGVTDSRQQGILLAMSAKNEDNYATVSALANGEGWHVNTRGNSQDAPSDGESKPFSFVFVPLGTPNVTMGAIWGAQGQFNEPTPVLKSGSNFNIAKTDVSGTYRLTIDGEMPTSGVLHVQSGNSLTGNGSLPGDNIVPYVADGDGWIITSDDMMNVNQGGANQNGQSGERIPYFQFVFTPFDAAPGTPTIQAPAWTRGDVFGFDVQVTEIRGYNAPAGDPNHSNDQDDANGPDMYTVATGGTQGLDFVASRMGKGDNAVHVNGALPTPNDGVMLATISEGLRNNTATGGFHEYGVVGVSAPGGQWEVHTSGADASTGEFNINFSVAFFGKDSGFETGVRGADDVDNGFGEVTLSGVNSLTDGVLMAVNGANEDNFVVVNPKNDGSGWEVQNWDNGLFVQDQGFNYVYLPYETENLVAGRVNPDGSLINSTNTGEFTLVKEATGSYLLTVDGRTPDDGMLLLVSGNGDGASVDNNLVYEAAGNSFRILGVDLVSNIEKEAGAFTTLEDTSFQFAFIDYITPPVGPGTGGDFLAADFDQDGAVDGDDLAAWKAGFGDTGAAKGDGDADGDGDVDGSDFLTWQRQLGTLPPATAAAAAVPEPHAAVLMACGVALGAFCRGRRS